MQSVPMASDTDFSAGVARIYCQITISISFHMAIAERLTSLESFEIGRDIIEDLICRMRMVKRVGEAGRARPGLS